jgi:hypothetical protein
VLKSKKKDQVKKSSSSQRAIEEQAAKRAKRAEVNSFGPFPARRPAKAVALPGRNEVCVCGSGRKFKACCAIRIAEQEAKLRDAMRQLAESKGELGPAPVFEPESFDDSLPENYTPGTIEIPFQGSIEAVRSVLTPAPSDLITEVDEPKGVEYSHSQPEYAVPEYKLIDGLCRVCEHPELKIPDKENIFGDPVNGKPVDPADRGFDEQDPEHTFGDYGRGMS